MLAIPSSLQSKFEAYLRNKTIPDNLQWQIKNGSVIIWTTV